MEKELDVKVIERQRRGIELQRETSRSVEEKDLKFSTYKNEEMDYSVNSTTVCQMSPELKI